MRLQAGSHAVAGWVTYGCRLGHVRLQAGSRTVAGCVTYGCRLGHVRLQVAPTVTHSPLKLAEQLRERPRAAPPEGGPPPPLPGEASASVDAAAFERGALTQRNILTHYSLPTYELT